MLVREEWRRIEVRNQGANYFIPRLDAWDGNGIGVLMLNALQQASDGTSPAAVWFLALAPENRPRACRCSPQVLYCASDIRKRHGTSGLKR